MTSNTFTSSTTVCAEPATTNYSHIWDIDKELTFYYNYTSMIMRFVIDRVEDEAIERVATMLTNPKQTSQYILEDVMRNNYIIVLIFCCIAISFLSFAACVITYCCSPSNGTKQPPGTGTITCAIFSFVFCVAMSSLGCYLFTISLGDIRNGLTVLPKQLNKSSVDISGFVAEFGANLRCNFNNSEKILRQDMTNFMSNIANLIKAHRSRIDSFGTNRIFHLEQSCRSDLNHLIALLSAGAASSPALKQLVNITNTLMRIVDLKPLHGSFNDTRDALILLEKDIDVSVNQIDHQKSAILSELSTYKKTLDNIVEAVDSHLTKYQTILFEFTRENDYVEESTKYIPFVLAFPLILVSLAVIGLLFLFLRYLGNFCSDEAYEEFPIRNAISDVGARILDFGGYVTLLVCSVLFLMVAICFVIAFISMFLCMGLFEDHDLRLLNALPNQEFEVDFGKQRIRFVLYDIFYKCKHGFPFFDAIDGDKIWARKEVGRTLSALRKNSFRRRLRNFYVEYKLIDDVSSTIIHLRESSKNFRDALIALPSGSKNSIDVKQIGQRMINSTGQLTKELRKFKAMISDMSSRSRRDKFSKEIQTQLDIAETSIIAAIAQLLRVLTDLSPQCRSLMSIWNDIGFYLCNVIAVPAQGLWVACLITGIGSFAIYFALFNATTFLYNYEEEKAASIKQQQMEESIALLTPQKTQSEEVFERTLPRRTSSSCTVLKTDSTPSTEMHKFCPLVPVMGQVEWRPVDELQRQLLDLPPGVKFIPVVVMDESASAAEDKMKMKPAKSKRFVQRVVWVPSRQSITQGSWQALGNKDRFSLDTSPTQEPTPAPDKTQTDVTNTEEMKAGIWRRKGSGRKKNGGNLINVPPAQFGEMRSESLKNRTAIADSSKESGKLVRKTLISRTEEEDNNGSSEAPKIASGTKKDRLQPSAKESLMTSKQPGIQAKKLE